VYKGLAKLFAMSFGIDFIWCIIGMAVLTGIFVIGGGYIGSSVNNFLQGIIMLGGIIMVVAAVLNGQGGFTEAINRLSQIKSETVPAGAYASIFGPDPIALLSVFILTSIGTWGLPQMVHKFYAIKDEKAIKKGTIISTVFALIIAGGSYFMGSFGRLYYSAEKVVYDDIVPTMIAAVLPDAAIGIVLIVVLSASISTLAALVLASSSTFIMDFLKSFIKFKNNTQLLFIRSMCAVFILISVVIALNPTNLISTLMSLSWGAIAGAFLGPFVYGLFWKGTTSASVWASMIFSLGFVITNSFIKFTSPTIAAAIAMLASLVIVPLVSLITPKLNKDYIQQTFACYDKTIAAQNNTTLGKK
jgi:SSS family solute:Na+ symporter